ncbi:MAG: DUF6263 family protein [Flavobacteriaceae bacterium]|nr:DUF6263 family protein [Flavobacteriaceae bacterium]
MKKLTLLTLVLITLMSCGQQDKIELGLDLKEGETYSYNSSVQMNLNQMMMGQEADVEMQMDAHMSFLNQGKNGSHSQLEGQYDYISFSTAMPQMQMKVSSDELDAENPMSSIFNQMVNQKFNFELSSTGRVHAVKGIEALLSKLIKDNEEISEMEKMQLEAQIQQTYGAEALSNNLETTFAIYPDKKVKIGDTWTVITQLQNDYPAQVKTTYTLVDFDDDYVYLEGEGEVATVEGEEAMEVNGMAFNFDLKGDHTSQIKLDRKTGWIIDAEILQNAKGSMTFANPPKGMEDQAVKMDMNYVIKVSN